MQTILGAGGAIGTDLARELTRYDKKIRLVNRNPKKVNPRNELFPADLMDAGQVNNAVEGSDVVYLTVGLSYNIEVWQESWPKIMQNVIDACKQHQCRLVFFDNMYMYDPDHLSHMTEETPVRPVSKKGFVRKQIAEMLMKEVEAGKIEALIARAADFYGTKNSMLVEIGYKNFIKGKPATWMVEADKIHTYTYSPDAAKATALLSNTPNAYNQVWHVPTTNRPMTSRQWLELFAKEMGVKPKIQVFPKWTLTPMSFFIPVLKELKEMLYQQESDYVFDSSKFEKRFVIKPTPPEKGVKATVEELNR